MLSIVFSQDFSKFCLQLSDCHHFSDYRTSAKHSSKPLKRKQWKSLKPANLNALLSNESYV